MRTVLVASGILTIPAAGHPQARIPAPDATMQPAHLHGFHFSVDARGDQWRKTTVPLTPAVGGSSIARGVGWPPGVLYLNHVTPGVGL